MDVIVFGAGHIGETLLSMPLREGVNIVFVCDNDKDKWGMEIGHYTIECPNKIMTVRFDYIILAMNPGWDEVRDQLQTMGVNPEKTVIPYYWNSMEHFDGPLDKFFIVTKQAPIPFSGNPAAKGESSKSYNRRLREGFFEKYCQGAGLDIGYGSDPLLPTVAGWDYKHGDAQYLRGIKDESFDYVYSSHCLEHMVNVRVALQNWFRVVRKGGFLLLAVPDRDLYEKKNRLPSRWNADHKHMFLLGKAESPDTLDILEEINESLTGAEIIYAKRCDEGHTIMDPLVHSDGEYQIEVVIQKCCE